MSPASETDCRAAPNGKSPEAWHITTATTEPHVDLTCSQDRVIVYGATTGFYPSYPWPWTRFMTLSSTAWNSGEASCTAKLYSLSGRRTTVLASISFTAGA